MQGKWKKEKTKTGWTEKGTKGPVTYETGPICMFVWLGHVLDH